MFLKVVLSYNDPRIFYLEPGFTFLNTFMPEKDNRLLKCRLHLNTRDGTPFDLSSAL